jgi:Putative DNA-binding domain
MPDLATFQLAFATAIGRTGRRGALERQPGFAVYRNTSPSALIDVLRGAYPVTAEILGDEGFGHTAYAFARRNPPLDPLLIGYGAGFADFLAEQAWAAELPYLADVAAIERLRAEAHIAADALVLDFRDLAQAGENGWAGLRLPLHPAARFAWLTTPGRTIWQAHVDGFETLEPEWRAEGVLVARPGGTVVVHAIAAPEHRLLSGLRLCETVGQAMVATAALYPDADIASAFANIVNRGALARPPSLERN